MHEIAFVYYVYLLESLSDPKRRHVGFSEDLRQRLLDHNEGRLPRTSGCRPWRIKTYVAFSSKREARLNSSGI
jgi:putative endonuclease